MHIPVLLQEVLEGLHLSQNDNCIDGTVGLGGHARAMLERTSPAGKVIGIDRDRSSLMLATEDLEEFGDRFIAIHDSYANILNHHETIKKVGPIQGILIDLGLSSYQLDLAQRGFAFRFSGPLDMRFDQETPDGKTAATILNTWEPVKLEKMFRLYGEIHNPRRLVDAIVSRRSTQPFVMTTDLLEVVEAVMPKQPAYRRKKIHPATVVFQALRIAVNDELTHVEKFLPIAVDLLAPGGRFAVISFHSLEDRIVKHQFKEMSTDCICPPEIPECRCEHTATIKRITKKPIIASEEEIARNPRARSAKLRIVEKI